jgi:hypothetical protein
MDFPATASPSGHPGALVVVDELTRRSALSPAAARTCPTSQGVGRPSLLSSAASGDSASERICIAHRESTWAWMCVAVSDEPSSGSASDRAAVMMKLPERSRNSSMQPQRCRSRRSVSKLWTNWTSLCAGLVRPDEAAPGRPSAIATSESCAESNPAINASSDWSTGIGPSAAVTRSTAVRRRRDCSSVQIVPNAVAAGSPGANAGSGMRRTAICSTTLAYGICPAKKISG